MRLATLHLVLSEEFDPEQAEKQAGALPLRGSAILTFTDNGDVRITWNSRPDMREREARIAP